MKKFTVSEDTEVVLDGKRMLLEAGDELGMGDEPEDINDEPEGINDEPEGINDEPEGMNEINTLHQLAEFLKTQPDAPMETISAAQDHNTKRGLIEFSNAIGIHGQASLIVTADIQT